MNPPVRAAVLASPEYPFTPVDAPIKLDQNESSLDLPEALKAKVLEQLQALTWNRYPDLNGEALSAAIGAHDDWPAAGTVAVTGSNVLIALLVQLAGMGARVLTVKPNFALYALDAKLWGAELIEVPLGPDFATDVDALPGWRDLRAASACAHGLVVRAVRHRAAGTGLAGVAAGGRRGVSPVRWSQCHGYCAPP
jgi:histidinol-phosphate aminotransferase